LVLAAFLCHAQLQPAIRLDGDHQAGDRVFSELRGANGEGEVRLHEGAPVRVEVGAEHTWDDAGRHFAEVQHRYLLALLAGAGAHHDAHGTFLDHDAGLLERDVGPSARLEVQQASQQLGFGCLN